MESARQDVLYFGGTSGDHAKAAATKGGSRSTRRDMAAVRQSVSILHHAKARTQMGTRNHAGYNPSVGSPARQHNAAVTLMRS